MDLPAPQLPPPREPEKKKWLAVGAQLAGLNLGAQAESGLSGLAHDAMQAARALRNAAARGAPQLERGGAAGGGRSEAPRGPRGAGEAAAAAAAAGPLLAAE